MDADTNSNANANANANTDAGGSTIALCELCSGKLKKFLSLFSRTEGHTKLKLGLHMDSKLMYHVFLNQAAGVNLFLYFFNFLSLKFQNIKFFITLFCKAYKVETWYTHGQRVDLLCTPTTSSQKILVPLFFFFPSLKLAKIKNLLLQNCFNIPLMAMAGDGGGDMWALLTLCYIFCKVHVSYFVYLFNFLLYKIKSIKYKTVWFRYSTALWDVHVMYHWNTGIWWYYVVGTH